MAVNMSMNVCRQAEAEREQLQEQLSASHTLDTISQMQTAAGLQQEADLQAALLAATAR